MSSWQYGAESLQVIPCAYVLTCASASVRACMRLPGIIPLDDDLMHSGAAGVARRHVCVCQRLRVRGLGLSLGCMRWASRCAAYELARACAWARWKGGKKVRLVGLGWQDSYVCTHADMEKERAI